MITFPFGDGMAWPDAPSLAWPGLAWPGLIAFLLQGLKRFDKFDKFDKTLHLLG